MDCRLNVTDDGVKALLKLSKGDMRRVLNILQSTHSAYETIDGNAVYQCTGSPMPGDISTILDILLNADTTTAFREIMKLKVQKGIALVDILGEMVPLLDVMDLPRQVRVVVLEGMAKMEENLASGCSEKIQVGGLVATFKSGLGLIKV